LYIGALHLVHLEGQHLLVYDQGLFIFPIEMVFFALQWRIRLLFGFPDEFKWIQIQMGTAATSNLRPSQ